MKDYCLAVRNIKNNEPLKLASCQDSNYTNNFIIENNELKIRQLTSEKCV